jgi:hypothetical protein
MITVLLLLPVLAILGWLYWYLLPGRSWKSIDSLIAASVTGLCGLYIVSAARWNFDDAGPLWGQIVSVVGAYAILVAGFSAGLFWRKKSNF